MSATASLSRVQAQVDLALGGDRTLRVSHVQDEHGASVVVALGFGGAETGRPFHRPSWGEPPLSLPAAVLPELADALVLLAVGAERRESGTPGAEGPGGWRRPSRPAHQQSVRRASEES